jgi:hypothetical protein
MQIHSQGNNIHNKHQLTRARPGSLLQLTTRVTRTRCKVSLPQLTSDSIGQAKLAATVKRPSTALHAKPPQLTRAMPGGLPSSACSAH